TVGLLCGRAVQRCAWIADIALHVGGDGEVLVGSHLLASIPGQGAAQLLGQFAHVFTERGYYARRVLARDFMCDISQSLHKPKQMRLCYSWRAALPPGNARPLALCLRALGNP